MIEQCRSPHGDNYSYVVYDQEGGQSLLVDPVADSRVKETLSNLDLTPEYVVNTHGHGDHTSGNQPFLSMGAQLLAHHDEGSRIGTLDQILEDGDKIQVGGLSVNVLHTPGHTSGSICLTTASGLLSGDTVFLAGCGNPQFGGNTRQLFESFKKTIQPLDDSLTLYPGHDYADRDLRFARSVDPDNDAIEQKLNEVQTLGPGEEPSSTLREEKSYNPFFRYDDPDIINELSGLPDNPSDWEVFKRLRERRNEW
ncbi:MAG: hydroxyacylglutathione hydrolase C-terminal domain-containing protein [bacterium]